jgi:hypothetical protein
VIEASLLQQRKETESAKKENSLRSPFLCVVEVLTAKNERIIHVLPRNSRKPRKIKVAGQRVRRRHVLLESAQCFFKVFSRQIPSVTSVVEIIQEMVHGVVYHPRTRTPP